MPGCDRIRTLFFGKTIKRAELHVPIAHHVWIWRSSCAIFGEQVVNDAFFIFDARIEREKLDVEAGRHPHRVASLRRPGTGHPRRIPALNKHARHLRSLLFQQSHRHSRVHPA